LAIVKGLHFARLQLNPCATGFSFVASPFPFDLPGQKIIHLKTLVSSWFVLNHVVKEIIFDGIARRNDVEHFQKPLN